MRKKNYTRIMKSSVYSLPMVGNLFLLFLQLYPPVQGQTAILTGTNYASGSGFCFGDQQLKEGNPFISCAHSGFTGTVATLTISWSLDGGSTFLSQAAVDSMFAGRIETVNMEPVEGRLNILNVTNLGVSSVACRITAFDVGGTFVGQTPLSAAKGISFVNTVPAPGVTSGGVSHRALDIVLMRPNGLCEGLSDNPITYVIEVFSDDVLITTRNVTSTGAYTNHAISDLASMTMYTVNVRAVLNVVSQSSAAMFGFTTLGDVNECETDTPPCSHICRNTLGSFICSCVSGYTLAEDGLTCNREQGMSGCSYSFPVGITFAVTFTVTSVVSSSVTAVVVYFACVRKKRSGVVKDTGTGGDIYEDPDRSDDIKMDPSPAYQTVASVNVP